ncbi:MAG TPA: NADP-dependent phosphogluconate dehydrogenase, partial [Ferruginibacter sp.]|nr:NADP-dependent phosphogluconate dehydrogenase [Ferruginibacter sp.]
VNIIHSNVFIENLKNLRQSAAQLSIIGINSRTPVTAFSAALNYFDAYCTERLPANLVQAQRDLFGAHTYERIDAAGSFHTDWK